MQRIVTILSFCFVVSVFLLGGNSYATNKIEKVKVEYLSSKLSKVKDSLAFESLIKTQLQDVKNEEVRSIIRNTFLANFITHKRDFLNSKSSNLFQEALQKSKELKRKDLELWISIEKSFYYYTYRNIEKAFESLVLSINILEKLNENDIIKVFETYQKLGFILYTLGDFENSEKYFLKAISHSDPNSYELGSITDGLGLLNLKQNDLKSSLEYFNKTLVISKQNNNQLRYAKALGNIASIHLITKNYKKAIELLLKDISISKKVNNTQNTIYALILLGKVYLENDQILLADKMLNEAENLATGKTYFKSSEYEINELKLNLALVKGDDLAELNARRKLEDLKLILSKTDGHDVITKISWEKEKINLNLKLEAEKAKSDRNLYVTLGSIIICLILIALFIFIIKNHKSEIKSKKDKLDKLMLKMELEKINSEKRLFTKQQTLDSYKAYLEEKNTQIEILEQEMGKIQNSSAEYMQNYSSKLQELLNSHLINNDAWMDFKKAFIQTYPSFYQFLNQNYPGLTDSNLRIIFLSKLDMNNTEIARVLGLTVEAVKKAKQRLKKKYGDQYNAIFEKEEVFS